MTDKNMTTAGAPTQTQFLTIGRGRIGFDDTGGNGAVVVGIPGMGDLRSEYRHLRPALVEAGYRVVTFDVRGFGDTSAQWDDYSAHAVGKDALALLDHLGVQSAVILGNSFAAGSALWAAHDAPERVTGVALLGPIVRDLEVPFAAKVALAIGFNGPWRKWFWMTYWNTLFPAAKPPDHEQAKAALSANLGEPGRMDALHTMIGLSKADTEAILGQSKVPALIVMGTSDPDFPDAALEAKKLAGLLSADTLLVDKSGHYPHAEFPDQVATKLLSFLKGLPTTR